MTFPGQTDSILGTHSASLAHQMLSGYEATDYSDLSQDDMYQYIFRIKHHTLHVRVLTCPICFRSPGTTHLSKVDYLPTTLTVSVEPKTLPLVANRTYYVWQASVVDKQNMLVHGM